MNKEDVTSARDTLLALAAQCGAPLSEAHALTLVHYLMEVENYNGVANLTSIPFSAGVIRHLLDSILPLSLVSLPAAANLLDVGSGGGFPGVPIAILHPEWSVTLLDDTQKKTVFLETIVSRFALAGVRVLHGRAEEQGKRPEMRERYDVVVSRAFAELPMLIELCAPFVALGGALLAYKGPEGANEVYEPIAKQCGLKLETATPYELPLGSGSRVLIAFRKEESTHSRFPRSMARIRKEHGLRK